MAKGDTIVLTDTDQGYKRVMKQLSELAKGAPLLTVGIHEDASGRDEPGAELTNAEIGAIHEFGMGNNPERAFLRPWYEQNKDRATKFIAEAAAKELDAPGATAFALDELGAVAVGEIGDNIADGIPPPLSPRRKREKIRDGKRGDTPLVHTGQLRQSIGHKVHKKGKGGG